MGQKSWYYGNNGRTDGQTDTPSTRDAAAHLKRTWRDEAMAVGDQYDHGALSNEEKGMEILSGFSSDLPSVTFDGWLSMNE